MRPIRVLLYISALALAGKVHALDIKVRLFSDMNVDKTVITPDTGMYYLLAFTDNLEMLDTIADIFDEDRNRTFYIAVSGNKISINRGTEKLGTYSAIRFVSKDHPREFRIDANGKSRIYQDDVQLRSYEGHLQIVNIVDMEKYVAGVVESEGGHVDEPEYFKAQAVLARTFALRNLDKHISQGYNLKDDVTSQVYFSKCHYKNAESIIEAVNCTEDTILVTVECSPILGFFHANSGGQTVGSHHAWSREIEYLQPKQDTFSIGVGSYSWERSVPKSQFYSYYASQLGVANDLNLQKAILNFDQEDQRKAYFEYKGRKLKLTKVRFRFNLRSTNFAASEEGAHILLKGKGYGHGVGMSQDGAIEMSRRGYSYKEILQFYFSGVELERIEFADCFTDAL